MKLDEKRNQECGKETLRRLNLLLAGWLSFVGLFVIASIITTCATINERSPR